jgi:hypothetical protein
MKNIIFNTTIYSFLLLIIILIFGLPFGMFYDFILFMLTTLFLLSCTINILTNVISYFRKDKLISIKHTIISTALLLISIVYVYYIILRDYPN